MAIRIATAPVSWGVMEVETSWGRTQTFESVLDEMVSAGYDGTELGPWGFLPTESKRLTAELSRRNIRLIGAFVPIALADPEGHQAGYESAITTAHLLAQCGAPVVVLADAMYERRMAVAGRVVEERDGLSGTAWSSAAKLLEKIAAEVNALGVRAVFHHHAGTYIETPSEVDRLLSITDPSQLGLCLDTGHYFYGGGDPVQAAQRYGARIWHLHLKDVRAHVLDRARNEKCGFLDAVANGVFCPLGEGDVDIVGVINELQAQSYDGWAVFEQDVDPTKPGIVPRESAAASRQYLRKVEQG
jgi:inosose dehydratase